MFTTTQIRHAFGIAQTTVYDLIQRKHVRPHKAGTRGRGNSSQFSFPQALALGVVRRLMSSPRGCSYTYAGEVVVAFAAVGEEKLRSHTTKYPLFTGMDQGVPVFCHRDDWDLAPEAVDVVKLIAELDRVVTPTPQPRSR